MNTPDGTVEHKEHLPCSGCTTTPADDPEQTSRDARHTEPAETLRLLRDLGALVGSAPRARTSVPVGDRDVLDLLTRMLAKLAFLVHDLAQRAPAAGAVPVCAGRGDALATAPDSGAVFTPEGDYWTVGWRGEVRRIRDVRALHYIAQLLRDPGREFHVRPARIHNHAPARAGAPRDRHLLARRAVLRATLSTGDKANAVAVRDSLPVLAMSSNSLELLVAHGGVRVEPVLTDINGDGLITTSCLGDENTQSPGSPLRLWCEGLDDLVTRPTWRTRNQAVPLATVYPQDAPAPPCGSTQLASALALDAPDAVVLAFGTADIPLMIAVGQRFTVPPPIEAIVIAYRSLVASAAASQVKTFIALTPPQGTSQPTQINELVAQLNNRLRHEFPGEQLIDFVAPMATQDYLPQDLDHMNQSGQSKRAAARATGARELANPDRIRPTPPPGSSASAPRVSAVRRPSRRR